MQNGLISPQKKTAFVTRVNQKINLTRLSSALSKLAAAASEKFGGDCYLHAAMAQSIMSEAGIPSKLSIGFAAWRVGGGDGDVLLHANLPGAVQYAPEGSLAAPFHVWLTVKDRNARDARWVLDFTTYQFGRKAADLDRLDGGVTNVEWQPPFLFLPKSETVSLRQVTQGQAGLCYYAEDEATAEKISDGARPIDPEDLATLKFIYDNPGIGVIGPNHT